MIECKICKTEVNEDLTLCIVCKYPLKGTEKDQASYVAKQVIQKSDVKESIERLKKARITLFVVGAFYIIVPFTPLMDASSLTILIVSIIMGLAFIGFTFLTYKKPLVAIGIPLGLTVLYYLFLLFIYPMYLWTGILWKIIILLSLGYGFFSVRKSNSTLKENEYLALVLGYGEIK